MKRIVLACFVFTVLAAARGLTAEPADQSTTAPKEKPTAKAAVDARKPVIPERKLTFDVSEEEQPMAFRGDDPALLEQCYVAKFRLVGPARPDIVQFGSVAREATEAYAAARERHGYLLSGAASRRPGLVESALREMPRERLPSEEVVSLVSKKAYPYFTCLTSRSALDKGGYAYNYQYTIAAPTPERAKELVQGLLSFYDYGVFYPLQKEALAVIAACEKRQAEARTGLQGARDEEAALKERLAELKEYADVTDETLASFTTQLRLIGVDLVGIEARIGACNKILADRKDLSPSRIDQVETVKITAEIELVGLAARKKALEQIVEKGRRRQELSAEYKSAGSRVRGLQSEIGQMSEGISYYEGELKKCMPYPVQDGKVVIRRIKWVSEEAWRQMPRNMKEP